MKKIVVFLTVLLISQSAAQQTSLLVLGDLHYDLIQDHDMSWLSKKPDDLRQVKEYTVYTRENWTDFMAVLKKRAQIDSLGVRAVIQLGDLSEGLAGTDEKADQMASNTMKAIDATQMPVPWIIAKGNHDITGPGAKEAFRKHYIPMFRKQTNNPDINNASYSFSFDNVQITCVDPWDKNIDMVSFLESELSKSKAKFKFVAIHEPVIPVTERCWHVYRNDEQKRSKLLEVIARYKAIVLCAHLHRYSVVRRMTAYGPVVQVMVLSVVSDRQYQVPGKVITTYGPSLAEALPEWQPETLEARKEMLSEEKRFITHYKQTVLPGYAVIKCDAQKESIILEYFAAFGEKLYDIVDLTKLLNPNTIEPQ